jgi:hypothetical protein
MIPMAGMRMMRLSNGLAFSCRDRAADHLQKTNDLAREAVCCNAGLGRTDRCELGLWERDQRIQLLEYLSNDCRWQRTNKDRVSHAPIKAFDLIGENRTCNGQTRWYHHLEWISFDLVCDRTEDGKTNPAVIRGG